MKVSFYEEFPNKKNLEKLRLLSFETEVYVAAKSLKEFFDIRRRVEKISKKARAYYWPILELEEGYWLSPFSKTSGLKRVITELTKEKERIKVVWDAELPFLKKSLFLVGLPSFLYNRKLISGFLQSNTRVLINENVLVGSSWLGKLFGLYFDPKIFSNRKTLMYYTSMLRMQRVKELFLQRIVKEKELLGDKLSVGVGCITTGIKGDEPLLSPGELERDLNRLQEAGIKEVIVYRLGGLNKAYLKVIEKYVD